MTNPIQGRVEYVMGGFLESDFNEDGSVDGDDFLIWQGGFNQFDGDATKMDGDATDDGFVDGNDFLIWQGQFGSGGAAAAAVPEPGTLGLLGLMLVGLALGSIRRNQGGQIMKKGLLPAIAIGLTIAATAMASSTNDREYWLGDDDGVTAGSPVNTTVDSAVPESGTQQDLDSYGASPTYVDVGPSGLARPGAGAGELGIQFVAADQRHLEGDRLGLPETTASSTGGFGPLDYSGIANRGFQLWVNPGVGASAEDQHIVMDKIQHGFGITADGNWFMQYNGAAHDTGVAVATDQWYHVMVVRPFGPSGPNNGARFYLDGVVIDAIGGGYNAVPEDNVLTIGANTGDLFDTIPGESNFFDGVLDDLEMFVMGTSTDTATDWGTFHLAEDNPIVAAEWGGLPDGDMDGDNDVDDDDVTLFIGNWRAENVVNGIYAGDINTRGLGDFNYDGQVNFSDWYMLRANHPDGGALNLGELLGGVPEPASGILAILGVVALGGMRRRR